MIGFGANCRGGRYLKSSGVINCGSIGTMATENIWTYSTVAMNEDSEGVEAPKVKVGKTPAQMETIKKARAKKAELDEARLGEKERLKAEARFDRLLSLFDKVRIETPEPVPEAPPKPKAKPKPKPKPVPIEEESYEEEEDDGVQKPKVKVRADPNVKTINLRFC